MSSELLARLRSQLGDLEDSADAVLTQARFQHDEVTLEVAASHRRQLREHVGLVDALLDALADDPWDGDATGASVPPVGQAKRC